MFGSVCFCMSFQFVYIFSSPSSFFFFTLSVLFFINFSSLLAFINVCINKKQEKQIIVNCNKILLWKMCLLFCLFHYHTSYLLLARRFTFSFYVPTFVFEHSKTINNSNIKYLIKHTNSMINSSHSLTNSSSPYLLLSLDAATIYFYFFS